MTLVSRPEKGPDTVIEATGVSHRFGPDATFPLVLDDVSLTVCRGEFVILTGPSGAGKTTLLTILGALRRPQSGVVRVLEQSLATADDRERQRVRQRIGFVFQDHHLFDELTARETLLLAMDLHPGRYGPAERAAKPREWLRELGIQDRENARPHQMSTGQRQRVAIARALVNDPELILADEPTASLDAESAGIALDCLKQAALSGGSAVVMISHDPRHHVLADRVIEMRDGRVWKA